jgi:hypothetical protein
MAQSTGTAGPVLQKYLDHARAIQKKLNKRTS